MSVETSIADIFFRSNTIDSVRKAVALVPTNALYHSLLAEHLEGLGLNPDDEFSEAARLSPLESRFWIRLGFRAEVEGKSLQAEQYLLHATVVDHAFSPRWALMNYYFRTGHTDQFWFWSEKSLEMAYGDMAPIFKLMWDVTPDQRVIRSHTPPLPAVLSQYLAFLSRNHLEAAGPAALELANLGRSDDLPLFLQYCDRSLESNPAESMKVWNILSSKKLIPYRMLDPDAGQIVTNGDFLIPLIQEGFDWRVPALEGVTVLPPDENKGFSIHLSRTEPEDCAVVYQVIPVLAGKRYSATFSYRSAGADSVPGFEWIVSGSASGGEPLYRSAELNPQPGMQTGAMEFEGNSTGAARLILRYRRNPGRTNSEGTLIVANVSARVVQ